MYYTAIILSRVYVLVSAFTCYPICINIFHSLFMDARSPFYDLVH